jgi:hypothetical protein
MLDGGTDLIPSMRWRTKGVSQGYVLSMGEQLLHGLGVPFHEHIQRLLIAVDQSIDIVYGRHLEITSTVETGSPFPKGALRPSYLFTGVRGRLQPVEIVGISPIATTNQAPNAPKPAYLVPNLGRLF